MNVKLEMKYKKYAVWTECDILHCTGIGLNVDLLQIFGGKTLTSIECMEHTTQSVLLPDC